LDVAKFAFAERSAAASSSASASASLSSAFSTVAAPVVPTLGAYDIRCSLTGRVVCERVVDLAAPEGRCIGYAVPASEDDSRNNHNDAEPAKGGPSHSLSSVAALQSPRHWIREYLHPREVDFAMEQPSGVGRTSFLLGRLALRQALESVSRIGDHDNAHSPATGTTTTVPFRSSWHEFADCVLLKDAHGRPNVPRGYLGSVSHKKNVAVALVARDGGNADGSNLARAPPPHDSTKPPTHGVGVDLEAAAPRNKISIARKVLTAEEIDALGNVPVCTTVEHLLFRWEPASMSSPAFCIC
jgi:4'-phosphopantetheinyl transferase N-terminal domain